MHCVQVGKLSRGDDVVVPGGFFIGWVLGHQPVDIPTWAVKDVATKQFPQEMLRVVHHVHLARHHRVQNEAELFVQLRDVAGDVCEPRRYAYSQAVNVKGKESP